MNENLVTISGVVGQVGQTLTDGSVLVKLPPIGHKLVYASVNASVNDAGLTMDIQDDTADTAAVAIAFATAGTAGEWKSTHFGGTVDPILFAGGSVLELDFNSAAANTEAMFVLMFLTGGL
jgi:hypothetical protein